MVLYDVVLDCIISSHVLVLGLRGFGLLQFMVVRLSPGF